MTAVYLDSRLIGFIPSVTPIYGNQHPNEQNEKNHAVIKEWLFKRLEPVFKRDMMYLPDPKSEYNGSLIIDNKHLFRVTTKAEENLYINSFSYLWDTINRDF